MKKIKLMSKKIKNYFISNCFHKLFECFSFFVFILIFPIFFSAHSNNKVWMSRSNEKTTWEMNENNTTRTFVFVAYCEQRNPLRDIKRQRAPAIAPAPMAPLNIAHYLKCKNIFAKVEVKWSVYKQIRSIYEYKMNAGARGFSVLCHHRTSLNKISKDTMLRCVCVYIKWINIMELFQQRDQFEHEPCSFDVLGPGVRTARHTAGRAEAKLETKENLHDGEQIVWLSFGLDAASFAGNRCA